MAYNYTIKFNGDISNIESLLSKKLTKEIQKVEENKITFTFDIKNGVDDLQDKLDEIAKFLDPTIGVQFKYEVDKKLLEGVKNDLQKEINEGFGDSKNAEHLRKVIEEITSQMKELEGLGANPDYISNISSEAQKAQETIEALEKSVEDLNKKLSQSVSVDEFDELKKQIDEANQKINELVDKNEELQNELNGKGDYHFSYYSDFVEAQKQAEELRSEVERLNEELLMVSAGGGSGTGGNGTLGFNLSAINRIVTAVEKISNAIGEMPEEGQNLLTFIQEVNESLKEVYANVKEINLVGTNVHIDMGDTQSIEAKQYLRKQFEIYKESYDKFFSGKFINPTNVFSAIANDKKYGEIFGYDVEKVKNRFGIDEITSLKDTEAQVKRIIEFFNTIDAVIKSRKKTPGYDKNFEFNKELNLANSRAKRVVKDRNISTIDEEMKAIENGVGQDILAKLHNQAQEDVSQDAKSLDGIISKLEEIRVILERITSENNLGQVFDDVISKLEEFKNVLSTINYDKVAPITDEQGDVQKWYRGVNGVKSGFLSNADDGQTYWTTNIELAQRYAEEVGKVYEAELKAKNVLELDAEGKGSDEVEFIGTQEGKDAAESLIGARNALNKYKEDLNELYTQLNEIPTFEIWERSDKNNEIELKKSQIKDLENEIEILESKVEDSIILGTHDISTWAQNNGYDGVIFNNVKTAVDDIEKLGSTMVVFSADQEAALKTITDASSGDEEKQKIQTLSEELEEVIKTIQSKTEQFEIEKQVVNNVVEEERNKLYELITTLSEVQATIESAYRSFDGFSNVNIDSLESFFTSLKKSIENIDFGSGFLSQINEILSKGEELKNLAKSLDTLSKNKGASKAVKKATGTDSKKSKSEKEKIEEVKKAYKTLISTEEKFQKLENKKSRSDLTKAEVYTYTKLNEQRKQAEAIIDGTSEKIRKEVGLEQQRLDVANQITKALEEQNKVEDKQKSDKLKSDLQSMIDKTEQMSVNPKFIESFRDELSAAAIKATKALNGTDDEIIEITADLDKLTSNIPKDKLESSFTKLEKLGLDVANVLNNNTAMSYKLRREFELLAAEIQEALDSGNWNDVGGLQKFQQKLISLQKTMKQAGQDGDSMWRRIGNRLADMNSKMIAQYLSWQDIIRYIRQISGEVIKLDTALTELRKVSDAPDDRLQQSLGKSTETAKELGATIEDVINVTADWARLGYNVDEAEELARVTTLFKNVGDNMSAEDASSYMISTLKGFEMEADKAMDIADKFNEVANNFAIDTQGIGEALQRSAASFNAANTDLNESIALITATNAVVQNPESVGE